MEPTVRFGDLLFVEMGISGDDVAAGGVFVITVVGMVMIKRLRVVPNDDLKISSDNDAHEPEAILAMSAIRR